MLFEARLAGHRVLGISLVFLFTLFLALTMGASHAHAATVSLVSATVGSNNASTTLAKVGDTVTYSLILSGTPSATTTPVINVLSLGSVNMAGSGTTWSYATTTSSAWTNGLVTFSLGWGGSAGEATTTITQTSLSGANVRFDKTAPTISSITSSNNCSTACNAGNTITFTLTPGATEFGGSVAGSYNGVPLSWSTPDSGAHYAATYTVQHGQSTGTAVQISGVVLSDAAGNASSAGTGSDVAVTISASAHTPIVVQSGSSGDSSSSSSSSSSSHTTTTTNTTTTSTPDTTSTPTITTTPSPVPSFVRDMQVGVSGDDVKSLQVFLNAHGFVVSATGAGSTGSETTWFGLLTKAALAKFQAAHGITPSVGYFGPKTRAFIAGMK